MTHVNDSRSHIVDSFYVGIVHCNCAQRAHMSSNRRKRKSSPAPEAPPSKRITHTNRKNTLSKTCSECNSSYSTERAHWAVCGRKELPCIYPSPEGGQSVILHRVDGVFTCIRCTKTIKKDGNMKVRLRSSSE